MAECRVIQEKNETSVNKSGAPNDRFMGNDLKWLVMHPGDAENSATIALSGLSLHP